MKTTICTVTVYYKEKVHPREKANKLKSRKVSDA
jgi:hypothetical protein